MPETKRAQKTPDHKKDDRMGMRVVVHNQGMGSRFGNHVCQERGHSGYQPQGKTGCESHTVLSLFLALSDLQFLTRLSLWQGPLLPRSASGPSPYVAA